jgi:hypothetical protein
VFVQKSSEQIVKINRALPHRVVPDTVPRHPRRIRQAARQVDGGRHCRDAILIPADYQNGTRDLAKVIVGEHAQCRADRGGGASR